MTGKDIAALTGHALRLAPALLRRDPIFRYAAIGALMALILLIGRAAQDWAGPGAIPATPPPAVERPSATGPASPSLRATGAGGRADHRARAAPSMASRSRRRPPTTSAGCRARSNHDL